METDKLIKKLENRLNYINNKETINKNRKKYQRQTWADRKDNPENIAYKTLKKMFKYPNDLYGMA